MPCSLSYFFEPGTSRHILVRGLPHSPRLFLSTHQRPASLLNYFRSLFCDTLGSEALQSLCRVCDLRCSPSSNPLSNFTVLPSPFFFSGNVLFLMFIELLYYFIFLIRALKISVSLISQLASFSSTSSSSRFSKLILYYPKIFLRCL